MVDGVWRDKCRACGGPNIIPVVDLGSMPPANTLAKTAHEAFNLTSYPLVMGCCDRCGWAQLTFDCSPSILFSDYPYFSSFSSTWLEHAQKFARGACRSLSLDKHSLVIEVASNDGYLLQYFKSEGCKVLGVDPAIAAADIARSKGIETISDFFGETSAAEIVRKYGPANLVVANNVLAHVVDPIEFLRGVSLLIGESGVFSCEFPHLERLLEGAAFDTIYHEHYSYISLKAALQLFRSVGLEITDVNVLETHGGSLRVWAKRISDTVLVSDSVQRVILQESSAGMNDCDVLAKIEKCAQNIKRDLISFLGEARASGCSVMGYGAAAKGATLLNYAEVCADQIYAIADLNPAKQNRFLPKSGIPIVAVEEIVKKQPNFVLILPWNLSDEIEQQLAEIREWGGQFVVAVPHLEVH